ncbi:hypothetical protein PMAYCL1PPCAC_21861, partial [Pristionchus mayeri]
PTHISTQVILLFSPSPYPTLLICPLFILLSSAFDVRPAPRHAINKHIDTLKIYQEFCRLTRGSLLPLSDLVDKKLTTPVFKLMCKAAYCHLDEDLTECNDACNKVVPLVNVIKVDRQLLNPSFKTPSVNEEACRAECAGFFGGKATSARSCAI